MSLARIHRQRRRRVDGRLTWPAVLGVEVVAGFLLLALLCAMAVNFSVTAMAKARTVNIWSDFRTYRAELVEQMAVTGDGFSIGAPASTTAAVPESQVAADDIETALAFRRPTISRPSDFSLATPPNTSVGGLAGGFIAGAKRRAQSEGKNFSSEVIDRAVVFRLELGGHPYVLAITPAAASQGIPGSLLWLCGRRQPPAGWYRLPGPSGSDLPDELIYSVCRDHRTF
ncbi:MAG: hypothetical protein H6Q35_2503 [Proteobacteria bacterium]|nr:hypothetical protein [Pseudomonadota bacterium]MBS1230941.1 hypothetical protein [Pseudomonadota bacterium]